MRDYYDDGYQDGYGKYRYDDRDYPKSEADRYSYYRGLREGQRHRRISNEIDREIEYHYTHCHI